MIFPTSLWTALAFTSAAFAAPSSKFIQRRGVVPHDSLNTIKTKVADNNNGSAILFHNPLLHIASGCQSYAAVDNSGNTSGGLKDTGGSNAGCRDDTKGQTYARLGTATNGDIGIMYSWYMPKDQPTDQLAIGSHRHDWENVVIWIDNPANDAEPAVRGGAASGHGDYKITVGALPGGDSPQVEYFNTAPTNHELQFTDTVGRKLEVLDWDAMEEAMRKALQETDFGSASVPFKDSSFIKNLDEASLANA